MSTTSSIHYDFTIPAETLKQFKSTYATDRELNLAERSAFFVQQDEELFERILGFVRTIYENYWVVIPIENEDFAYSVGFTYELNNPEIMIIGAKLTHKEYGHLINEIGCYIRDVKPLEINKDYSFLNEYKETKIGLNPEDKNLPTSDQRILVSETNKTKKIVPISKPLIFKHYDKMLEDEYHYGYMQCFYRNYTDSNDVKILVADLR